MNLINPQAWNEVKQIKFHHKVKRFYYKNLFRKIYTVAIIGLIGANVFSIMKYASFADESLVNETPTQEQGEVILTMGPVDDGGNDRELGIMPENGDENFGELVVTPENDKSDKEEFLQCEGECPKDEGVVIQETSTLSLPTLGLESPTVAEDTLQTLDLDVIDLNIPDIPYTDLAGNQKAIMAYNLGATTGEISDQGSYGRFYQWGNDRAWSRGTLSSDEKTAFSSYSSSTYNWTTGAQGPCPAGYHVPTIDERENLLLQRCENSESCNTRDLITYYHDNKMYRGIPASLVNNFRTKYNLPLAGLRGAGSVGIVGDGGYYSSSTPIGSTDALNFYLGPSDQAGTINGSRSYGLSVRCVEGSYSASMDPRPLALDLYNSSNASTLVGRKFVAVNGEINPAKLTAAAVDLPAPDEGYKRVWYLTNSQNESQKITSSTRLSDNTNSTYSVYAFLEESGYTLTFDSQGGIEVASQRVEEGQNRSRPADPTHPDSDYVFVDWYTSTGYDIVFDFTATPTDSATAYAKWRYKDCAADQEYDAINHLCYKLDTTYTVPVYYGVDTDSSHKYNNNPIGTITVKLDEGIYSGQTITMMDMNLGATQSGTECLDPYREGLCQGVDPTLGDHFQWGNNYGFSSSRSKSSNPGNFSQDRAIYENFGPGNWYSDSRFRWGSSMYDYWQTDNKSNYNNLRGGGGDSSENNRGGINNGSTRQGPCPAGYHVPSIGEWNTVVTYWYNKKHSSGKKSYTILNEIDDVNFKNTFLLPRAGERYYGDTSIKNIGMDGMYWSSSQHSGSYDPYRVYFLNLYTSDYYNLYQASSSRFERTYGFSVRCFKDSSKAPEAETIIFHANGGVLLGANNQGELVQKVASGHLISQPINPTKDGLVFDKWTTDQAGSSEFDFSSPVSASKDLYAQYKSCNSDEHIENDTCVKNTKEVPCTPVSSSDQDPNGVYATTGTINWNGGWPSNPVCELVGCKGTYYVNNGVCTEWNTATLEKVSYGYILTYDGQSYIIASGDLAGTYKWGAMTPSDSHSTNSNAWGGGNDKEGNSFNPRNNMSGRQGPCPKGYYVPSRGDWAEIMEAWCHLDSNECSQSDLLINSYNNLIMISRPGLLADSLQDFKMIQGNYRSSSASAGSSNDAWYLSIGNDQSILSNHTLRSNSQYIRCLANPDATFTVTFVDKNSDLELKRLDNIKFGQIITGGMLPDAMDYYVNAYYSGNLLIDDIFSEIITSDTTILVDRIPNKITVTYHPNGGIESLSLTDIVLADSNSWIVKSAGTDYNVNKIGYHPAGKYLVDSPTSSIELSEDSNQSAIQLAQLANKLQDYRTKDISIGLYVIWSPNTYTVTYDANDGVGGMDSTIFVYDDFPKSLKINRFVRPGYNFAGWKSIINGEEMSFIDGQKIETNLTVVNEGVITLLAQWTIEPYTISYNYDGGTVFESNLVGYNIETSDFTLNNPEKQGYTFDYWEENGVNVGNTVTIFKGTTGNKVFKAVYTPNTNTPYHVEHYQENIEGGYVLVDTDDKEGTTGEPAEIIAKNYEGFTVNLPQEIKILADGSLVVRVEYNRNSYDLIIINEDTQVISKKFGETVNILNPGEKQGYIFRGWQGSDDLVNKEGVYSMPAIDVTLVAQREKISNSSSYSSSSGRKYSKSINTTADYHNSANSHDLGDVTSSEMDTNEEKKVPLINPEGQLNVGGYDSRYTPEQHSAYQFAKSHGITTTASIGEAKMNTPITRIEMAKMLSYYAINVLGQTPDASVGVVKFRDITNKLDAQYDNGVTLAYQLGIMGINMPENKFRPNDRVTRAEFATALSRMIYGMEDGKGRVRYYEPHIARLYNEGIINNTNPKLQEQRGYVMIMLMRSIIK